MFYTRLMAVLTVGVTVQILAAASSCVNETVRFDPDNDLNMGPYAGYVQYCLNNEWNYICGTNFSLIQASIVCRKMNYSDQVVNMSPIVGQPVSIPHDFKNSGSTISTNKDFCNGSESIFPKGIDVNTSLNCTDSINVWVSCMLQNCTNGSLRLMGGVSYREGRVEACVDGRWGTVCYNEGLVGAVCEQLGFADQGTFVEKPKVEVNIPGLKVNCNTKSHKLNCSDVNNEEFCDNGGLYVQCQACGSVSRIINNISASTPEVTINSTSNSAVSASLGAVIAVLIVTQTLTIIALVVCSLRARHQANKLKQIELTKNRQSHELTAVSAYSALGPNYETVLDAGNELAISDYETLDEARPPIMQVSNNPQTVGKFNDDQFYNAEEHAYTTINKSRERINSDISEVDST